MNRRQMLATLGGTLAASAIGRLAGAEPEWSSTGARRRIAKVGVQLYTVRALMKSDFDGTLATIAQLGYGEVELAGLYGRSATEFRRALDANGLAAPSSHVPIERIRGELDAVLSEAHTLGHRYVVCPDIPSSEQTLDGYRRAADDLNRAGERARAAGITLGYHNHSGEMAPIGGVRPYDVMVEHTDPPLVVMEMDIFWLVAGGGDPLAYFAKYPGRFRMVHVKDMGPPPKRAMTDVGSGVIDWRGIFAQSQQAGIEHYFVEHDSAADPIASIRASHDYLAPLDF